MNTLPDDALARAIAAGQAGLRAMMEQPPAARPRPLTLKAYLAEVGPFVAQARAQGYSDAEIAEALSIGAERAKALGVEPLVVSVRALRQSCGNADKVAASTSFKARKPATKAGDTRVRKPVEPERHVDQEPARARGEAAGPAPAPARSPAPADPGAGRVVGTDAGSPGSVARPMVERDATRTQSPAPVGIVAPPRDAQPTGGSPAAAPRTVSPADALSPAAKHHAETAALRDTARGFRDHVIATDPANAGSTKPSVDRRPDPAVAQRGETQQRMF